jgi:hypothetical protein
MKKVLEALTLVKLTAREFGQHIKTIITNLNALGGGAGFITDTSLLDYIKTLTDKNAVYDRAHGQVTKSDETAKIAAADKVRDAAISAAIRYLNVFELSELESEKAAFASLETLFNEYKGLQNWNFEEETNGIDKLVSDLQNPKYAPHVATINMGNYVERMRLRNQDFKVLFQKRTVETSTKVVYDVKALRDDLKTVYDDMTDYVLSMAKAKNTEEFNQSLTAINAVRKYYADLIAKRKGGKDEGEGKE